MKKAMTFFAVSLLALTSHAQLSPALQGKLQDTLEYMHTKYHFKGLSAAVSYRNNDTWKSAVGESTTGVPLSSDMLIGIGSNTKTFTSTMMLKLYEDGLVDLSDTIGKWITGYANINGAITVRQLLNHTSGLYSYTGSADFWNSVNQDIYRIWTKEELVSNFVSAPYFTPGSGFHYSNTNYLVAGIIEEKITGRPVYQLIRDSILTPNHLNHTFFPPYEIATDPYANFWSIGVGTPWLFDLGNWGTMNAMLPPNINSTADAAGAMVSTPEDNVKFWKALMNGDIIKRSTLNNEMLQWFTIDVSQSYGLGIFKYKYFNNTVFSHGGTWQGQINDNLSDTTNNIFITVLSNQDSLDNTFVVKVVRALYKVVLDYPSLAVPSTPTTASRITCFPNPANNVITITHNNMPLSSIEFYDLSGKRALYEATDKHAATNTINVTQLPAGTYLLKANGAAAVETKRIVISK